MALRNALICRVERVLCRPRGEITGWRARRPVRRVKQSDIVREGAHEGLLDFTETGYLATNW